MQKSRGAERRSSAGTSVERDVEAEGLVAGVGEAGASGPVALGGRPAARERAGDSAVPLELDQQRRQRRRAGGRRRQRLEPAFGRRAGGVGDVDAGRDA